MSSSLSATTLSGNGHTAAVEAEGRASQPYDALGHRFIAAVLIIVGASFVLGLPILEHGPLTNAHDALEFINFGRHFSEQFWQGEFYPRWLIGMNAGLGSPSYFVYPPLPAYVCSLLEPLAQRLQMNVFGLAAWLPLPLSGLAAFIWLRRKVNGWAATFCAVVYVLMPYHLAIDLYRRCAIPECWAFVWMPLLLYYTQRRVEGKRIALWGIAMMSACMILSHLISMAMFFWIPILLVIIAVPANQRFRRALEVSGAIGFGAAMASFYFLSAVVNSKYISVSRLMHDSPNYALANQLVTFGRGLFHTHGRGPFLMVVSWSVVTTMIVMLVSVAVIRKWGTGESRKVASFWLVVAVTAIFLVSKASWPLWAHARPLQDALQFPWRFSALLCVATVALLAMCLSCLPVNVGAPRLVIGGILAVVAIVWIGFYADVWRLYRTEKSIAFTDPGHMANDDDGWLRGWIAPGTQQQYSAVASRGPKSYFAEGTGTLNIRRWEARHIEVQYDSPSGGRLMLTQYYYPAWKARLSDIGQDVVVTPGLPPGLISAKIPPGKHVVDFEIPFSASERVGLFVTEISCFAWLVSLTVISFSAGRAKKPSALSGLMAHE